MRKTTGKLIGSKRHHLEKSALYGNGMGTLFVSSKQSCLHPKPKRSLQSPSTLMKRRKKQKSIPARANISFWKEPHVYEINYESISLFHANVYVKQKERKKKGCMHLWWKPHLSNWFFFQMSSRSTSDSHLILKKEAMKSVSLLKTFAFNVNILFFRNFFFKVMLNIFKGLLRSSES